MIAECERNVALHISCESERSRSGYSLFNHTDSNLSIHLRSGGISDSSAFVVYSKAFAVHQSALMLLRDRNSHTLGRDLVKVSPFILCNPRCRTEVFAEGARAFVELVVEALLSPLVQSSPVECLCVALPYSVMAVSLAVQVLSCILVRTVTSRFLSLFVSQLLSAFFSPTNLLSSLLSVSCGLENLSFVLVNLSCALESPLIVLHSHPYGFFSRPLDFPSSRASPLIEFSQLRSHSSQLALYHCP